MRAATEGNLLPVMPQGNMDGGLGCEVRQGSPGELMVETSLSRQRRSPCKTNKEMSDEATDAAALTYLLTYCAASGQRARPLPLVETGPLHRRGLVPQATAPTCPRAAPTCAPEVQSTCAEIMNRYSAYSLHIVCFDY